MNEDHGKIIVTRIFESGQTGEGAKTVAPINKWVIYLVLVPVAMVMIVLGAFFFAAFLALFAIAAVAIGVRIWWVRRKLHQEKREEEGDYTIIEDAEIVESENNSSPK